MPEPGPEPVPETKLWTISKIALKAIIYAIVTFVPALLALQAVLQTVPGLSGNDSNAPLPRLYYGPPNASSYRQDAQTIGVHSPTDLLDDDPKTTWVECKHEPDISSVNEGSSRIRDDQHQCEVDSSAADSSWSGEFITLPLADPVNLKALSVRNGDQYSVHEYYRSPRARDLQIEAWTCTRHWYSWSVNWIWDCVHPNNGVANVCWVQHLADERGYQTFAAPTGASAADIARVACDAGERASALPGPEGLTGVTQVRLTVLRGYEGERQQDDADPRTGSNNASDDLAISDVALIPAKLLSKE